MSSEYADYLLNEINKASNKIFDLDRHIRILEADYHRARERSAFYVRTPYPDVDESIRLEKDYKAIEKEIENRKSERSTHIFHVDQCRASLRELEAHERFHWRVRAGIIAAGLMICAVIIGATYNNVVNRKPPVYKQHVGVLKHYHYNYDDIKKPAVVPVLWQFADKLIVVKTEKKHLPMLYLNQKYRLTYRYFPSTEEAVFVNFQEE